MQHAVNLSAEGVKVQPMNRLTAGDERDGGVWHGDLLRCANPERQMREDEEEDGEGEEGEEGG